MTNYAKSNTGFKILSTILKPVFKFWYGPKIIGKENMYRQLENSSVIVAKYSVGGDDSGTIGLIGPTRMDYENIIPSVRYLTDFVGRLITQALED